MYAASSASSPGARGSSQSSPNSRGSWTRESSGGVEPGHRVAADVDADEGGEQLATLRVEPDAVIVERGGEGVRPDAVGALVPVHGAEGDEVARAVPLSVAGDGGPDRHLLRRGREDAAPPLVEQIDHVGVAVAREPQQVRLRVLAHEPAHERPPAALPGVVQVHHQAAADVNEEDGVLVPVGDGDDVQARRELDPLPTGEDSQVKPLIDEVAADAAPHVVREEQRRLAQPLQRLEAQVIGVAVRDPDVGARRDGGALLLRDRMGPRPAPEVCASADPGIGRQHRTPVIGDDRRVTDRLEPEVHAPLPTHHPG